MSKDAKKGDKVLMSADVARAFVEALVPRQDCVELPETQHWVMMKTKRVGTQPV